jgi:hypothetical protein
MTEPDKILVSGILIIMILALLALWFPSGGPWDTGHRR